MRLYSVHFQPAGSPRAGQAPVLVKEGFSPLCLVTGWLGLLLQGSWMTALLAGALSIGLAWLLRHVQGGWPVAAGWQMLLGLFAHDLRRWELGMRGFASGPLVAGRNADSALLRLLDRRPELLGRPG